MTELFPATIETGRLRLEALAPDTVDVFEFYDICSSDPDIDEVTEYLTWEPHPTPKATLDFLERAEEVRAEHERAPYLLRPREGEAGAGEIAGGTGFGVDWEKRTMTLGMWLRKPFWGRGYSGERAAAFIELAFEHLDLELVSASAHVDNEKSNAAIGRYVEAYGGGRDGLLRNWMVDGDEVADLYRYSVSEAEYRNASPSEPSVRFEW